MTRKKYIFFAIVIINIGCKKESSSPQSYECTGIEITYSSDIKPIMDASCVGSGCHNSQSKRDGYDLSNYYGVKQAATSSAFLGSIRHESGYKAMPRGKSKLNEEDIKKIYCWTKNGMLP